MTYLLVTSAPFSRYLVAGFTYRYQKLNLLISSAKTASPLAFAVPAGVFQIIYQLQRLMYRYQLYLVKFDNFIIVSTHLDSHCLTFRRSVLSHR